jgi:membrane protease subunit HflC
MGANRIIIVLLVIGVLVASTAFFIVDERQLAIKFQLGRIVDSTYEPGLHFMYPLFFNNVRKFDKRILTLDTRPERFLTGEKKNVMVDFFVKWRIADPATYYTSFTGDERQAALRLLQIIKNSLQLELGNRTIQQVVSEERTDMMEDIKINSNSQVNQFGIEIVDVRFKRIELPTEVQTAVFQRMQAERARIAAEHRAQGEENAKGIRAVAERERTVILAEANRDADMLRGKGDAAATEIYGKAYGKNREFYEFYRSMNAYRDALADKQDMLILQPDSEFFKYFNNDAGGSSE